MHIRLFAKAIEREELMEGALLPLRSQTDSIGFIGSNDFLPLHRVNDNPDRSPAGMLLTIVVYFVHFAIDF